MNSRELLDKLVFNNPLFTGENWDISFDDQDENIAYVTNEETGEDFMISVASV